MIQTWSIWSKTGCLGSLLIAIKLLNFVICPSGSFVQGNSLNLFTTSQKLLACIPVSIIFLFDEILSTFCIRMTAEAPTWNCFPFLAYVGDSWIHLVLLITISLKHKGWEGQLINSVLRSLPQDPCWHLIACAYHILALSSLNDRADLCQLSAYRPRLSFHQQTLIWNSGSRL